MVANPSSGAQNSATQMLARAYADGFNHVLAAEIERGSVGAGTAPGSEFFYRPGQLLTADRDVERVGRWATVTGVPADACVVDEVTPRVVRIRGSFDVPTVITRLRDPRVWDGSEVPRVQPHHVTVGYGTVLGHPRLPPQPPVSTPVPPQQARASYGSGVTVGLCDTRYLSSAEHLVWFTDAVEGEQPRNLDVNQFLRPGDAQGYLGLLQGHGTFVACVLRETAPGVRIRVEEALNPSGIGDEAALADALFAAADDAQVVLVALGCLTMGDEPPLLIEDALPVCPTHWSSLLRATGAAIAFAGRRPFPR